MTDLTDIPEIDIERELADILSKEIREEYDRHVIGSMIDEMFPNKDKFISFTTRMGYDSDILPDEGRIGRIELYNLMNIMYNTHIHYHINSYCQG